MGVCEEDGVSESEQMMDKKKTDYPESLRNMCMNFFQKNKPELRHRVLIAGLIFVTIVLSVTLILVWSRNKDEIRNEKSAPCEVRNQKCAPCEVRNQQCAPCEDDWIWHRGKCYYFSTERDTWRNSQKFCHSHESSLAIIDNKEELDFLFRHKDTDNHWIGVRRTDDNTGWTWTNGSLYNENLFRITRQSEHSGKIEYVFLNHEGVRSQEGIYEIKWICNKR